MLSEGDVKLVCLLFLLFSGFVHASIREVKVCASYGNDLSNQWSKKYIVNAFIGSGMDFNNEMNCYNFSNCLSSMSNYVVIFWDRGQASFLKLRSGSFLLDSFSYSDATDREGRRWKVAEYDGVSCPYLPGAYPF